MIKDDQEHPVPEEWRDILKGIADAFAAGDFELRRPQVEGVLPISAALADSIRANVNAYGQPLAPLDQASWQHSVCRWMDGYWQVLVDLSTVSEPVSDLTLHAKVHENEHVRFEVGSVDVA